MTLQEIRTVIDPYITVGEWIDFRDQSCLTWDIETERNIYWAGADLISCELKLLDFPGLFPEKGDLIRRYDSINHKNSWFPFVSHAIVTGYELNRFPERVEEFKFERIEEAKNRIAESISLVLELYELVAV